MSLFFNTREYEGKIFSGTWSQGQALIHDTIEPASGEPLFKLGMGSREDVETAVSIAAETQAAWADLAFDQRAGVIRRAAELLQIHAKDFIEWNVRECGSTYLKAQWELHAAYEQLNMASALPMQADGMTFPSSMPQRRNTCRRVPLGVVGVIAPWNFPLLLSMRSVAPALALGNTVVLKPDFHSGVTGGLLIARLFEEAGLPEGVLHVVPGGADAGDALVRHPKSAMISFTGSTAVGKSIGKICGEMLKKVALELGGNNAFVVLEDADLDAAASNGAWGSYLHQGQICMQAGRHFVHESVAEAYVQKLTERARQLKVADPFKDETAAIGPLVNLKQLERIEAIIQSSIERGAKRVTGGRGEGLFYHPTVLCNVTAEMPAFSEELFAPVAPVITFTSEDELVELIAQSPYGLAAAIQSASVSRAMHLARRIKAGMIHINDQTVNNEFHVPFGGVGDSGNSGRFGGPANLEMFTELQWLSIMDTPIHYPF
ncbi:benzaldehyde dehydrogenase (NAD) [Paenalcaligenes hominis]|uniref:Benzaldehyde dehydrogenase (NAD) n=1 Tax=Paenalcaligenes hominis TaxID=643674 RepID=A0ABX0WTD8_9BURK|nr:aldehyde dehydrogenase family protein [Paenalcaligenes hominis]NJB66008.1 benzaldehyde dehydrogenase (NAD) [Paenalcaligenes hominis]